MPDDLWKRANCYGYALGLNINIAPGGANEGASIDWFVSADIGDKFCEELINACERDGLEVVPNPTPGAIAAFINKYANCLDYHFYLCGVGSWSHKLGAAGTVETDIINVKTHNEGLIGTKDALGDTIIGQRFIAYMRPTQPMTNEMFGL